MRKKLDCILLIDDNESDNYYNQIIIDDSGLAKKIFAVESGFDGLEYLKHEGEYIDSVRPNLILLDINMPKMNGFEFLEEYKKLEEKYKADILVMMLTTSTNPRDIERAKNLGIDEFYSKPLSISKLEDVINKYF